MDTSTSGIIYFIGEIEVLSRKKSNFVKIGLVRTTNGESAVSAINRLYEHQAKQPRELFIIDEVNTNCVSIVEALLHVKLAQKKVRGEWFILNDDEVKAAIHQCRELANEFDQHSKVALTAENLALCASSNEVLMASDNAIAWVNEYQKSVHVIKSCETVIKRIMKLVMDATELGIDTTNVGFMRQKTTRSFNALGFSEKYPEIYNSFLRRSSDRLRRTFQILSQPKSDTSFYDDGSLTDFHVAVAESVKTADRYEAGDTKIENLKISYLELTKYKKEAEVDKAIASDYLKSYCGTAREIQGVCRWDRTENSNYELSRSDLKRSHPDEYEEFMVQRTNKLFTFGPYASLDYLEEPGHFE
jgi:hypothetical protein